MKQYKWERRDKYADRIRVWQRDDEVYLEVEEFGTSRGALLSISLARELANALCEAALTAESARA